MSNFTIRAAETRDLDQITEIYDDAVRNGTASYELEPPSRAEMETRFRAITSGDFPYIVAEENGAILGYAYAGPFRPRAAYRFVVENSVYVAPAAKGKGLGKALMRELIRLCETSGFRQMIAVIGDGRADSASVILHEKMGFSHSGKLTGSGYKHGRWLDTVFMQYAMNGGSEAPPDQDSLPERKFRQNSKT